jgi:glucose-6-phosphate 1-dehydrogenase
MLFNRTDELMSSWKFITNILEVWEQNNPPLYMYQDGSWGPKEATELIERDGRHWI